MALLSDGRITGQTVKIPIIIIIIIIFSAITIIHDRKSEIRQSSPIESGHRQI